MGATCAREVSKKKVRVSSLRAKILPPNRRDPLTVVVPCLKPARLHNTLSSAMSPLRSTDPLGLEKEDFQVCKERKMIAAIRDMYVSYGQSAQ